MRNFSKGLRKLRFVLWTFFFLNAIQVLAGDSNQGSSPRVGYPEGGPPTRGSSGSSCSSSSGPGVENSGDPMAMQNADAAMEELRKTDPALAAKMEKFMKDAKDLGEEVSRKAQKNQSEKQ